MQGFRPRAPPSPTINIVHNHYPQGQEKTTVEITEDTELLHVEHRDHVDMIEGHLTPEKPRQYSNNINNNSTVTHNSKQQQQKQKSSSLNSKPRPTRPVKPIRLHVHILHITQDQQQQQTNRGGGLNIDVQFMTTAQPNSNIYRLKKKIEAQFSSLFPESPPLVIRALADPYQYLLPDPLIVEDVLMNDSQVHVVAEGEAFGGVEALKVQHQKWDAGRTVTQARGWISHSAYFLAQSSRKQDALSSDRAHATIPLLCDLITSSDDESRKYAGQALWRYASVANFEFLAPRLTDGALRNICNIARFAAAEHIDTLKGCALFIYRGCNVRGVGKRLALCRGREACMALAAHAPSQDIREMVTEALMVLDRHAEEVKNRQQRESRLQQRVPQRGDDGKYARVKTQQSRAHGQFSELDGQTIKLTGIEHNEWGQMIQTIRTLLASDREDSSIYIAELVNRATLNTGFLTHIQHDEESFALLGKIVSSTDSAGKASASVANLLSELCTNDSGRSFLLRRASFALLSQLCMSRDPTVRTHAVAIIREICGDKHLPMVPTEWLLALARSPVIEAQRSATKGLSLLAGRDIDNAMAKHAGTIVALASADDPFVQRFAAEALGILAMKELNKRMIVKLGGLEIFASFLKTEAEIELQRIGAKALANLSSTDKDTRIAVVKYVNKHVPDWQNFNDHIVNVYLEMLFTS
jgi:hypothetical protein